MLWHGVFCAMYAPVSRRARPPLRGTPCQRLAWNRAGGHPGSHRSCAQLSACAFEVPGFTGTCTCNAQRAKQRDIGAVPAHCGAPLWTFWCGVGDASAMHSARASTVRASASMDTICVHPAGPMAKHLPARGVQQALRMAGASLSRTHAGGGSRAPHLQLPPRVARHNGLVLALLCPLTSMCMLRANCSQALGHTSLRSSVLLGVCRVPEGWAEVGTLLAHMWIGL
jgi:hypothetical protein